MVDQVFFTLTLVCKKELVAALCVNFLSYIAVSYKFQHFTALGRNDDRYSPASLLQ